MTTTSVLLIDADPAFRRETAAALAYRGFGVHEADSLRQAVAVLKAEPVDLLAVEGVLSDPEVTTFVSLAAREYAKVGIVFVSKAEDERSALDAAEMDIGINLVVRKPIPAEELAYKIAVLLKLEDKNPGALSSQKLRPSDPPFPIEVQMDDLRANYEKKIPELFRQMGQALVDAQKATDLEELETAKRIAHSLNGTAGSLGFADVCGVAHAVEHTLKEIVGARALSVKAEGDAGTGSGSPRSPISDYPVDIARAAATEILVIDDDPVFLEEIARLGRENLIRVHPAACRSEALEIARQTKLDGAFIDVYLRDGENPFQIANALRSLRGLADLPIAFISADNAITTRIAAVHAGGSLFLDKPIRGDDFAQAVRRLAPQELKLQPRILVVDDDQDFLGYMRQLLEAERMKVDTLSDPARILDRLPDVRPDLILLDVVMPGVNGFDVCRILRSTELWRDVPVLFLTIHAGHEILIECFEAGGDDYIEKPVLREELIARLRVRLDRVQISRERADRDTLTGLATRRAFIEQLKMRMSEASRSGKPVSLCLLDLDRFKEINDKYGHLAGDRVLARFGHLLGSRFRTMDARGRWAGEEFALAFYGEPAETAKMIVGRVKEELATIGFRGDHGEKFGVVFSAGIATFPEAGRSFEEMVRRADEKLVEAKKAGGSCIVS